MADDTLPDPARKYTCTRCQVEFDAERRLLEHLAEHHAGESDGTYDYACNIVDDFP